MTPTRAAIYAELHTALSRLGCPLTAFALSQESPADLYQIAKRHGAKSDLLGIIGVWDDGATDEEVLAQLKDLNA